MTEPRDIKERTFEFAIQIVALCRELQLSTGRADTLAERLLSSGTSIGAHVEDAHGNHGKAEFISKICQANNAARDAKYWLRLLAATESVPRSRLAELIDESSQLIAILTTIAKRSRENLSHAAS